jgi:prefoldin subunit 5
VLQHKSLDSIAAHFEGIYEQLTALAQRIALIETKLRETNASAKDRR